jgi:hypothetical protein
MIVGSQHGLTRKSGGFTHHSFAETLIGFLQNWLDLPIDPLQFVNAQG